jgi:integrase
VVERVRFELLVGSRRIGRGKRLGALRDALLISLMEMTGCRPGEALGLRWSDLGERIAIVRRLSGKDIVEGTKNGRDRSVPLLNPLREDLDRVRELSGDPASEYVFRTPAGGH